MKNTLPLIISPIHATNLHLHHLCIHIRHLYLTIIPAIITTAPTIQSTHRNRSTHSVHLPHCSPLPLYTSPTGSAPSSSSNLQKISQPALKYTRIIHTHRELSRKHRTIGARSIIAELKLSPASAKSGKKNTYTIPPRRRVGKRARKKWEIIAAGNSERTRLIAAPRRRVTPLVLT